MLAGECQEKRNHSRSALHAITRGGQCCGQLCRVSSIVLCDSEAACYDGKDVGEIMRDAACHFSERADLLDCTRTFFFQAEDGIRYLTVTGVQTCALPIYKTFLSVVKSLASGRIFRMTSLCFT